MSSYRQIPETRTLAETLGLATAEIIALHEEMDDLCAAISAAFPETHQNIKKYWQAYNALEALDQAKDMLTSEPLNRLPPPMRNFNVTARVGRQTRRGRTTSQRVRLGNAVARLKAVQKCTGTVLSDLGQIIGRLEAISFPKRYG